MESMACLSPNPCYGISGVVLENQSLLKSSRVSFVGVGKQNRVLRKVFSDSSHLDYYVRGEAKEMRVKKKLVKRLSKDLDFISRYGGETKGFGLAGDDDVKGNKDMILDAAEVLLSEVRQLKAELKEGKRRRKAEKQGKAMCGDESSSESSSSSSSESSDDECREVVNLRSLRNARVVEKPVEAEPVLAVANDVVLPTISNHTRMENVTDECCSRIAKECSSSNRGSEYEINGIAVESAAGKIEVCMGGKCKKMGATALMEEFERKVGVEGAVVGCKCMGKCKNAPNVKVSKSASVVESIGGGDSSVTSPTNPLFLGVSLNDVDMIVAHFEGNDSYQMMPNST